MKNKNFFRENFLVFLKESGKNWFDHLSNDKNKVHDQKYSHRQVETQILLPNRINQIIDEIRNSAIDRAGAARGISPNGKAILKIMSNDQDHLLQEKSFSLDNLNLRLIILKKEAGAKLIISREWNTEKEIYFNSPEQLQLLHQLNDLDEWITMHFLHYFSQQDDATNIGSVLFQDQNNLNSQEKIILLASCSMDNEMSQIIGDISKHEKSSEIFSTYCQSLGNIQTLTKKIEKQFSSFNSNDWAKINKIIFAETQLCLKKIHKAIEEGNDENISSGIENLKKEEKSNQMAQFIFDDFSRVLQKGKNINLNFFSSTQKFILEILKENNLKKDLLKILHQNESLSPIPEIFWEVDRDSTEYNRRFGFDLKKFLKRFTKEKHPNKNNWTLLEFGPGSGVFKEERSRELQHTDDFAMCDKVYYPVNKLIESIIDFEALTTQGVNLNEQEKSEVSDFIYRVLVIKKGETEKDNFAYDQNVSNAIEQDPQNIVQSLKAKLPLLKDVTMVPSTNSSRDTQGNLIYPRKIEKNSLTENSQKALDLICTKNIALLKNAGEIDIFEHIPAYTPGDIISDFADVKNLGNRQIDFAFGCRSTIYKYDQDYIDFMKELNKKISIDGIYIDDNIRCNDGWRYRLSELLEVQKDLSFPIRIIKGPGFSGEDHNQKDPVPLAVVITNDSKKLEYISSNLDNGYTMQELSEIVKNENYLKSLDSTGLVHLSIYKE